MRLILLFCFSLFISPESFLKVIPAPPVQLTIDASEAEQALFLIEKQLNHKDISAEDWQKLFTSLPYKKLKAREATFGNSFSDEEFKEFLLSESAAKRYPEWKQALVEAKRTNLLAIGKNILAWLPDGSSIHAQVLLEIKPKHNSFIWKQDREAPSIFLNLENKTQAQVENTILHECHHLGMESLEPQQESAIEGLPVPTRTAVRWLRAFGEGEAMLAAAGSVDRHPHWMDDGVARARWDSDMLHLNSDLKAIQGLMIDILDGKFKDDKEIAAKAAPFWGYQGAWYTLGYEMSALVEKQKGRQALKECLLDPRKLLIQYNEIAKKANADGANLALWEDSFLSRLGSTSVSSQLQPLNLERYSRSRIDINLWE